MSHFLALPYFFASALFPYSRLSTSGIAAAGETYLSLGVVFVILMFSRRTGLIALIVVLCAITSLAIAASKLRHPRGVSAIATIRGGPLAPDLKGIVEFRRYRGGTLLTVRVNGLPEFKPGNPPIGPHGFHIHALGNCNVSDPADPFNDAGGHWNPDSQPHPNHAGDLPVLFSNEGRAYMVVYTNRFTPDEVIGKSIIIHENPDDYRTQPSGASGRRLACGVVKRR